MNKIEESAFWLAVGLMALGFILILLGDFLGVGLVYCYNLGSRFIFSGFLGGLVVIFFNVFKEITMSLRVKQDRS